MSQTSSAWERPARNGEGEKEASDSRTAGTSDMMPGGPCSKTLLVPGCPPACEKMSLVGTLVRKPTMHRHISTKVLLAEGGETPFTEHCRKYETMYRALQMEIQNLKDQVQELHRDLTKHHSLIKTEIMSEILQKSLQVDVQIASKYSSVEMMRSTFEETWEETYQRVANEQEIYEAQLHDLLQLKQENSYLTTITKQIAPYVRSIAKVKERLEPRLQEPKGKEEEPERLFKISDEDPSTTDGQHRTDLCNSSGNTEAEERPLEPSQILPSQQGAEDSLPRSKDHPRSKQRRKGESPPQAWGPHDIDKEGDQGTELLLN